MEDCDSMLFLVTDRDTNEFVINPDNTSSRPCLPGRQANAHRVGGGSAARRNDVRNRPRIIPVYVGVSLLPPPPHPSGHTAAGTSAAFVPPRIWCTPEGWGPLRQSPTNLSGQEQSSYKISSRGTGVSFDHPDKAFKFEVWNLI